MDTTCTFVLFGATGDLSRRMLFPSLYSLHAEGFLRDDQGIVGTSHRSSEDDAFRAQVRAWVKERVGEHYDDSVSDDFAKRISYISVDANHSEDFRRLRERLDEYECEEIVFYLSTSPSIFGAVCQGLKANGFSRAPNRIVVEKPIGSDLASNIEINETVAEAFSEDRTFRIDHYLGKETVQNLIALRFGNRIFEPLWNAQAIESVQITIAETVGAEGRGGYYDEYGAIRDMVQNHLLQLVCLVAMEPPTSLSADSVRNEKVKVLRSLAPITPENVEQKTVRGQYEGGYDETGGKASTYKEDVENEDSDTESYVAIAAEVENWRWAGVPFYLETGKRMAERNTQIVIRFREVPHSIFGAETNPNELIINLQPEERITLQIMNKKPGLTAEGMPLQELGLNLSLAEHHSARRRIAYEQLILDALNDNPALFVQRDEQEAAWRWIDGIVGAWKAKDMRPAGYRSGSMGPASKHSLTERNDHSWYV
ncbi:glucose-6-phosphate dehydrogenase [Parvularcula oceani]|uniref:glucose-6-phosphate dehydrogenase n=1 Tax=Parvularcula oceani TaxID=1247963 RepID=UPI0004E24E82|nr:glucose-6-phosphate dehydrogenase [Parvularcula oceani]